MPVNTPNRIARPATPHIIRLQPDRILRDQDISHHHLTHHKLDMNGQEAQVVHKLPSIAQMCEHPRKGFSTHICCRALNEKSFFPNQLSMKSPKKSKIMGEMIQRSLMQQKTTSSKQWIAMHFLVSYRARHLAISFRLA